MLIEYNLQKIFLNTLDLVDIGNTGLHCTSKKGMKYIIITKTVLGKTSIFKIGPYFAGADELLDGFSILYKKIDYNENKIIKEIASFINEPKKDITSIEEELPESLLTEIPDLIKAYSEIEGD